MYTINTIIALHRRCSKQKLSLLFPTSNKQHIILYNAVTHMNNKNGYITL